MSDADSDIKSKRLLESLESFRIACLQAMAKAEALAQAIEKATGRE